MPKDKLDQLIQYVTTERFSGEIHKAKDEYQKIAGELFEDDPSYENRMTAFLEWYVFDRPLSDKTITPLELFIEQNRDNFTLDQTRAYEDFLRAVHAIFVVKKIKEDHVVVYNLFDQNKYKVLENDGNLFFHKNDVFEGRILPFGDKYSFTGTFCYHPQDTTKFIETESKKIISERKHLDKTLKIMNSDLISAESRLKKVSMEADKMKIKVEKSGQIYTNKLLEENLAAIETTKTEMAEQVITLQKKITDWKTQNIKLGFRRSCENLIQKLSYMSLKWERSRQIALGDIYRNA